jgi:hypothetical protein
LYFDLVVLKITPGTLLCFLKLVFLFKTMRYHAPQGKKRIKIRRLRFTIARVFGQNRTETMNSVVLTPVWFLGLPQRTRKSKL